MLSERKVRPDMTPSGPISTGSVNCQDCRAYRPVPTASEFGIKSLVNQKMVVVAKD
jgi:hypothetical protein